MYKKIVSLMLCISMVLSLNFGTAAYASQTSGDYSLDNDFKVESTNAFGSLLSSTLDENTNDEDYTKGYNISEISVNGGTAEIKYQALENCTMLVGIYSDDGQTMLTSGKLEVSKDKKEAMVTFTDTLPEYFQVKAYLIENGTLRPLSREYSTPYYTKAIQDVINANTDHFDQNLVYNLDDDKTNNFAVYKESVIKVNETDGKNVIDYELSNVSDNTYVFRNADFAITNAENGSIIAYNDGSGNNYYIKVNTVNTDENQVTTVMGDAGLDLEDVFDYVKIIENADAMNAKVDETGKDDGVSYVGKSNELDSQSRVLPVGATVSGETSISLEYEFVSNESPSVQGLLDKLKNHSGGPVPNETTTDNDESSTQQPTTGEDSTDDDDDDVTKEIGWAATAGLD